MNDIHDVRWPTLLLLALLSWFATWLHGPAKP